MIVYKSDNHLCYFNQYKNQFPEIQGRKKCIYPFFLSPLEANILLPKNIYVYNFKIKEFKLYDILFILYNNMKYICIMQFRATTYNTKP